MKLLPAGAACGALAGLGTSVAAYVWVEPVLSRAITLEDAEAGPISRTTQRLVGMPLGFVLTGAALGLLFALVYRALPRHGTPWRRSLALALTGFLALALVPQLRYPANPPGVGDPQTLTHRTSGYLLAVVLGVAVVSSAWAALRALDRRGVPPPVRQPLVVAAAVATVAAGYALLPPSLDAVEAPANLVFDFRIRSLGLLALLWALLGACFGALVEQRIGAPEEPPTRESQR